VAVETERCGGGFPQGDFTASMIELKYNIECQAESLTFFSLPPGL